MVKKYQPYLKIYSRNLRTLMTDAEQLLWKNLRRKQIRNVQFNRQKPVKNFIVDFYSYKARLVIELDGGQHSDLENTKEDSARDKELLELGLLVLRFDNFQVLNELNDVIAEIDRVVAERI